MNCFGRFAVVATTIISLTVVVLVNGASGQQSDTDAVRATLANFFVVLSSRDISKMEPLWVRDANVVLINPPDKAPSIGWDAVKKNWEARYDSFSEWSVTPKEASNVQINQGTAATTTLVSVQGKNKAGAPQGFSALVTQVFVKRGDRWLLVSNHASRVPD
jgi:ketosteroid isomerase-like protein